MMKPTLTTIAALCLTCLAVLSPVQAADADQGLARVTELAQVNGQALACQDMDTVAKAKKLMLAHAPKTPRFGSAFEEATNASYLAQVRGTAPCPAAAAFASKLDALAKALQTDLPAASNGMK
jgi:hypothetical protein